MGIVDVDAMLASIPLKLLMEWMAFGLIEPYGAIAAYERAAIPAHVTANAFRDPKKRARPFSIADLMPQGMVERTMPSQDELQRKIRNMIAGHNADNARRRGK